MDFVKFEIPEGPEWELLIAAVVVLIGPLIVERLRIPGLVGLLFGGMVVGPNVLGLTDPQGGIVSQLGAIGLLYLMFMAGLDLDLNVFAKVRNQAVTFALMTFFGPFALGFVLGATIGYELGAAALLGSVFASHTLVTYPLIRSHGLSTNRAVAITVGATVITDTLALIVLAVVSGQASGDASGVELISQVALGLLILSFTCFVILPWIGRIYFATIGRGPCRPLHVRRRRPAHRFCRRIGRRHRTDRRRLLRRPRHQPAGAQRERDHGAHRVLRRGAPDPDLLGVRGDRD